MIASGTSDVVATYQGNSAAFSNDLYLVNTGQFVFNNHASAVGSTVGLGSFAPGTELIFNLRNMVFAKPGVYRFQLFSGDALLGERRFEVRKMPQVT